MFILSKIDHLSNQTSYFLCKNTKEIVYELAFLFDDIDIARQCANILDNQHMEKGIEIINRRFSTINIKTFDEWSKYITDMYGIDKSLEAQANILKWFKLGNNFFNSEDDEV